MTYNRRIEKLEKELQETIANTRNPQEAKDKLLDLITKLDEQGVLYERMNPNNTRRTSKDPKVNEFKLTVWDMLNKGLKIRIEELEQQPNLTAEEQEELDYMTIKLNQYKSERDSYN